MNSKNHFQLLVRAFSVWLAFLVLGLPHYYQQYSTIAIGIACTLLSVVISSVAIAILAPIPTEKRISRAMWISLYFTVPFALLDFLYCGIYLEFYTSYLLRYWYLTIFYFTPWLTFPPTAYMLNKIQNQTAP